MKPFMIVDEDNSDELMKMIDSFRNDSVLVGIPQEDTERKEGDPIGNAALLFINNFGSPANNIPPRPVMEIGIRNAQDAIAEEFKKAAKAVFSNNYPQAVLDQYYNRAGIIASNSIKRAINDQEGFEGPADSTLESREARGFKGTKALIVTGQMRNAITYVVKNG